MKRSRKDEKALKKASLPGLFLPGRDDDHKNRKSLVVLSRDESETRGGVSPPAMNSDSDCACE